MSAVGVGRGVEVAVGGGGVWVGGAGVAVWVGGTGVEVGGMAVSVGIVLGVAVGWGVPQAPSEIKTIITIMPPGTMRRDILIG
jgi:hypothetical protein